MCNGQWNEVNDIESNSIPLQSHFGMLGTVLVAQGVLARFGQAMITADTEDSDIKDNM